MDFGFVLKKFISMLVMPLPLGLILAFIGLLYLYKNNIKKAKLFLTVGVVWIVIISSGFFSNFLLSPLENKHSVINNIPKDVKYILLLGGDLQNRGWEVLKLYTLIPNSKIITSGYEGNRKIPEAVKTANLLQAIGIPKKDIIIHSTPKDTKDEAIKIKQFLGTTKFILVTSAYHMPRALALFKKEGLNPIPAPANFLIQDGKISIVPNAGSLFKTRIAWHEYLGLLWAKIRGQI